MGNECTTIDTTTGFDEVIAFLQGNSIIKSIKHNTIVGFDPGTSLFNQWREATMKGRQLLKDAGVGRWQWEPAMAFRPGHPMPERQEGDTLIPFSYEYQRWWIYAEPKRETTYGRLKRQREEREAKNRDTDTQEHG